VQLGVDPVAYRLDYSLEAPQNFVTRRLHLECVGEGWWRCLTLARAGDRAWTCEAEADGDVALDDPGGDTDALSSALDCDLGYSPLTNTMPIRRSGLHRRAGAEDFLMAWVSVPDLGVHAMPQRYEHVRGEADGAVVRYSSANFAAELELDPGGLVVLYPGLARRVS
jgi:hypothetical protein